MDNSAQTGSSSSQHSAPVNNTTPPTHHVHSGSKHFLIYILVAVIFLVGIVAGYILTNALPKSTVQNLPVKTQTQALTLPKDAEMIETCSNHQGQLYIRPIDIPQGPVYMVNNGKIIGLEYMLAKQSFLDGQGVSNLPAMDINVNHVDITYEPDGHAGYNAPHYHVDLYLVPNSVTQNIVCAGNSNSNDQMNKIMNMGSTQSATPSNSMSASPTATMKMSSPQTKAPMSPAPTVGMKM